MRPEMVIQKKMGQDVGVVCEYKDPDLHVHHRLDGKTNTEAL